MFHYYRLLVSLAMTGMATLLYAQCGLQAGPMPGASDMLEVTVWVQTTCAATVDMVYWPVDAPGDRRVSDPVSTEKRHGFTAHLIADQVSPGRAYDYAVRIDGQEIERPYPTQFRTQDLWQWRKPAADFTFLAGSCTYVNEPEVDRPGTPYGGGFGIFAAMTAEKPDLMVWLGDNVYLREVDWNSKTGVYHRYTHTRSLPEMQPLLAAAHHYATWDDHDYGPNDSDRSYWLNDVTLQAFKDFWANPNYGAGGTEGITGTFFWEDCQFFILDDRWYRDVRPGRDYFGQQQLDWLIQALRFSKASYKFICTGGQVLSDAALYENYAVFADERRALLDSLDKYDITGVVFLTGDRHHSEITEMTTADGDTFVDITSSALTSSTRMRADEANTMRVPGSMVGVRNYARLEVAGPRDNRTCTVSFRDEQGAVLFSYSTGHARK
jgi:alkaline phosphatase D